MKPYKQTQLSVHSIKELPAEDRPREKLIESGTPSLTDTELLAALLGSGSVRTPAHVLAAKVQEVLDKHAADDDINALHLQEIDGMGPAKAAIICAALELGRRRMPARRKQIVFPADVFPLIRHFGDREQEHFLCIPLNGAHEVISVHVVSIGLVNHTLVHPREVFAKPLQERATAVIVAHNHPSGNLNPSGDDKNVTKRLKQAGELLGIQVLDHIVFSDAAYHSMLESGEL